MKKLFLLTFFFISFKASAFEIYALGTSNTNCKGANQAYTRRLNELLPNTSVINGGVNGDQPAWMLDRLKSALEENPNIKLVIFEPGPNDLSKFSNLKYSAEILDYLKAIKMPVIYVSHIWLQNVEEAEQFAKDHGAYYYGDWTKNVPTDKEHRQFDYPIGSPGHMTQKGCLLWANQMAPFVLEVMKFENLQ